MARYRDYSRAQAMMIPIRFQDQIQPGTFEHTIDYLVDNEIDLGGFESRYRNDDTGAPAIHPSILLKIVLFGYSRGIVSSRGIGGACEENVVFMALSADTRITGLRCRINLIRSGSDDFTRPPGDRRRSSALTFLP